MGLIHDAGFDQSQLAEEVPVVHALIIGVDEYLHGEGKPENGGAPEFARWQQLDCAVESALLFTRWLLNDMGVGQHAENPRLGNVRLLLSPEGDYDVDAKGTIKRVETANLANVESDFTAWFQDCDRREANIALFYFCGHGFENVNHYLLLQDAGASTVQKWKHCIDFTKTHIGMESCKARTQCYFIDACREAYKPPGANQQISATVLASPPENGRDRDAPIYMAAGSGSLALAPAGQPCFFTTALVDCLTKFGAGVTYGRNPYWVTTSSLRDALSRRLLWERGTNHRLNQNSSGGATTGTSGRLHATGRPTLP
jgi:hypothetical protein